jgi:membrane fusion protein (multidrug efflux system)
MKPHTLVSVIASTSFVAGARVNADKHHSDRDPQGDEASDDRSGSEAEATADADSKRDTKRRQAKAGSKTDDGEDDRDEDAEADDDEDDQEDDDEEDDRSAREKAADWLKTPKHRLIAIIVAIVLIGALIAVVIWWAEARKWQTTDNAYIRGPIARLSPGVSGNVTQVFVVDNQLVRAGQPLASISVGSYEVALRQAEAEVATAQAAVLQAEAAWVSARAQVRQAAATARARDAEAFAADREYRRYASLSEGAVAEQQRDRALASARSAAESARAADETTHAQDAAVGQAQANIVAARARVRQAEANLANARLRRGDAVVVAPIAGRVTQFDIEPGDYLSPGQPLAAIVGPARWVEANFKEDQLRLMRRGQQVELTIAAYSGFKLVGYVDSFQAGSGAQFSALPPQNATGNWVKTVQRVPVKIRFRRDAFRAFPAYADVVPGLSVSASVKVMP